MGSRKAGKTHNQARQASRSALLRAGAELLLDEAQRDPFGALRVRAVCEQAGYTTGAFYLHWPDAESFKRDLAERLLSDDPMAFESEFDALEETARQAATLPPREAISHLAREDLQALLANEWWDAVELLNVTWSRTPQFRDAAQRGYRDIDALTTETYAHVLEALDREARPPLTLTELGTALQALVEGFALRHKVDPNPEHLDLYRHSVIALLMLLTRKRGDETTIDQAADASL